MELKNIKKDKGKIVFLIFCSIVFLFLIIQINLSVKGIVLNRYTNEPIGEINVDYFFKGMGVEELRTLKSGTVTTNSEGKFTVPPYIGIRPFWHVMETGIYIDANEYFIGKSKYNNQFTHEVSSNGENLYFLIPRFEEINDCEGIDDDSVKRTCYNALAPSYAIKVDDMNYCNYTDQWRERSDCYIHFAKKNNNVSICYLISNASAPGGGWSKRDFCFKEVGRCELAENPNFGYKVCGSQWNKTK